MELRQKFSLLAFIYALSLFINLGMSAWCIAIYFGSAFTALDMNLAREHRVERLRMLVRRQRELLEDYPVRPGAAAAYAEQQQAITAVFESLQHDSHTEPILSHWEPMSLAFERKNAVVDPRLISANGPPPAGWAGPAHDVAFLELDNVLGSLQQHMSEQRQRSVERAQQTQKRVLGILIANAAAGSLLCVLGLVSMRRWVIQPVAELREATRQIASGNFMHHIDARSGDELGKLAGEVNSMCSTIVDMQRQLVEQERLAGAGEMVTRLAHNIRNPLGAIRGLAEAVGQRCEKDAESVECLRRITDTVDRFGKWLRDLQQSVSPLSLNPHEIHLSEPIHSVLTALRPMLDRRRIQVQIDIPPDMPPVRIDALHFEQALAALLTNAVQASEPGQTVRVSVGPAGEGNGRWRMIVEDCGSGIPPDLHEKIFLPYFSTKQDGSGLGLPAASKVVKLHGGELTVESSPGAGSRFIVVLPGAPV